MKDEYYGNANVYKDEKSGRYRCQLPYYDANGKRKFVSKLAPKSLKTVKEQKRYLREWEQEQREAAKSMGFSSPKSKKQPTVAEKIKEYLDYQLMRGDIEKTTHYIQMNLLNTSIAPYIGDYIFSELDVVAIEQWHTALSNKGLKQGYIRNIMQTVKKTYNHYYRQQQIKYNPFDFVKMPKFSSRKVTHLSNSDFTELILAVHTEYEVGSPNMCALYLAIYGGLRIGEICGLRWIDINFDTNMLTVSTSIGYCEEGFYTKGPKTQSSCRTFPMVPQLAEMLQARRDEIQPSANWFVVGDKEEFLHPAVLARAVDKLRTKYELKDIYDAQITMHGLRHNFATTGVRSNVDISSLAKMMGHANVALTLNTYSDTSPDALMHGAAKLGATFSEESGVEELVQQVVDFQ